jgi:hypothetical protein
LESELDPYSGGGHVHRNGCAVCCPGMGNPRRMGCSTFRRVQADSKVQTTFSLDEKTPVFNGTCWSLAGEDYKTSDWAQLRGRKEEDPRHREMRQTQQEGGGHSEIWASRSEPRGIDSHRQGATIPYSNQPG